MPTDPTGLTPPALPFSTPAEAWEMMQASNAEHAQAIERLYRLRIQQSDADADYRKAVREATLEAGKMPVAQLDAFVRGHDDVMRTRAEQAWLQAEVYEAGATAERIRSERDDLRTIVRWVSKSEPES